MNTLENNPLYTENDGRKTFPKPYRERKTPVTIIVGIICSDGIVLASDSQMTRDNSKRCDAEKMSVVEFANLNVLVAQAGNATLSNRAVEILQGLAKNEDITDYRSAADAAQRAMQRLKEEMRIQQGNCSPEELREFILRNELNCKLMLAHYFSGKSCVYIVDLFLGIANRINSHYAAIGCGANLGEYLLSELCEPGANTRFASVVATYVVELVKKHDAFCGGSTKLGVVSEAFKARVLGVPVFETDGIFLFPRHEVEQLERIATEIAIGTKEERSKKILIALDQRTQKLLKAMFEESMRAAQRTTDLPRPPQV